MKQLLLCLAVLFLLSAPCLAQDPRGPFADVPTGPWAYRDVDALQKAGIVFGKPVGTYSSRPMLREEFVLNTAHLLSQLSGPDGKVRADIEMRLLASHPAISALQDLVSHFKPELKRLNVNVDIAQARLAEIVEEDAP